MVADDYVVLMPSCQTFISTCQVLILTYQKIITMTMNPLPSFMFTRQTSTCLKFK